MGMAAPQNEKTSYLATVVLKFFFFGTLAYPFVWIKCLMFCRAVEFSKEEKNSLRFLSLIPLIYLVLLLSLLAIIVLLVSK